jgi:hypothetical protein
MLKTKIIIVTIISLFIMSIFTSCNNTSSKVVDKYDVSKLATDFGGAEAYDIGANINGMPVFKNPSLALKQAIVDYGDGFEGISKEFQLGEVSKTNYEEYKIYGWQLTTGTQEEKKQGRIISQFFDIYENSFE